MISIVTPEEYNLLSYEEQNKHLDYLKSKLQFTSEFINTCFYSDTDDQSQEYNHMMSITIEQATVYRPFNFSDMPKCYTYYIDRINKKFPKGEMKIFRVDDKLYERLYAFYNNSCLICLHNTQIWDEGDKDIEKLCTNCGNETMFIRHWNEY